MSRIFSEIGWITSVIDGGYKSYRGAVLETLNRIPKKLNLIKISGKTGTGKTDILRTAEKQGAQIIDLEQLAKHRGSLLGQEPNTLQPKQRLFESRLCSAMLTLDLSRPVFIEAESNKIGQIHIPAELWARMRIASQVKIEVPIDERIKKLCLDYKHMIAEPKNVIVRLSRLKKRYGRKIFEKWKKYLETEDWYSFVKSF